MASSSRPSEASDLGPGTLLDGKYEILNLLGAGGMGEVFKARHVHLNAFRCIKVMKQDLLDDDVYRARFLREARLATQIHHPNIAVVHDFFLGEGRSYMVTEFIDGTTVRQWCAAYGRFPLAIAADVAVQVLEGLDHIHRRGLLHRDISSDNVMLSYGGDDCLSVKIIDLGIAKEMNTISANVTQSGLLIGNPKYMSPEQFGELPDGEQLDGRADLYCLGVVLYEMLLGVPPFVSETPHGYIMKHLTHMPPRFNDARPGLAWPDGLEAVILRTLEKDRRRRYADARELVNALQGFLSAPAGTLTRAAVALRRGQQKTTVKTALPGADAATVPGIAVESDTQREWRSTIARDTLEAYREYIAKHPDAPDSTEARARVFELSLIEVVDAKEKEGDRDALQRLSRAHPPESLVGKAAREALARVRGAQQDDHDEETAFQSAWEEGTSAGWLAFVETHSSSSRVARARELLEEARAFEATTGRESETELREFLKLWPDGRHHLEAEIRLSAIRQRLADLSFADALAADTYAAMRDYLAQFPSSLHTEEARRALEERLTFETATVADSEDAWENYLTRWRNDVHAKEARARRDRIRAREAEAYRVASEAKTAAAWNEFLANHPDGRQSAQAERNRREAVAFETAGSGGRAVLEDFLHNYPNGLLAKEARRLARQLADDDDFAHAQSLGTAASWALYLTTHPAGNHVAAAHDHLEKIERTVREADPVDWNAAWETGTLDAWDAYLAAHADSAHARDARRCRQEAIDFDLACRAGSAKIWRAFLKSWPDGRHHLEASIRLGKAKG